MRKPKSQEAEAQDEEPGGAVKRFKLTATGKIKRGHSMKRHILTKKAPGRKRGLRKSTLVSEAPRRPNVRRHASGRRIAPARRNVNGAPSCGPGFVAA